MFFESLNLIGQPTFLNGETYNFIIFAITNCFFLNHSFRAYIIVLSTYTCGIMN